MIIDSNSSVNSSSTSSTKARATAEAAQTSKSAPKAKPEPSNADSVSLSVKAQTMGRLEAKIAEAPDVDEAKVEAVKAAIREGRYQVDSATIADRMLKQDSFLS